MSTTRTGVTGPARRRLTRAAAGSVALALGLGLTGVLATQAHAVPSTLCAPVANPGLASGEADFDGDGAGDVAYGLPTGNPDGLGGAVVVKASAAGTETLSLDDTGDASSAVGDGFGTVVRAEPIDADACTDLVVSAPGAAGQGRVYVLFGSADGLGQGRPTLVVKAPRPAAGDRFGAALDTDSHGYTMASNGWANTALVVGSPGATVTRVKNAGTVHRFALSHEWYSSSENPAVDLRRDWSWTQGASGVGTAEANDRFGEVVEVHNALVIVGVPSEDIGKAADAGALMVRSDSRMQQVTQRSAGVATSPLAGDRFGASLATGDTTVAVGVPGEDVGRARNAGMLQLFRHSGGDKFTPTRAITLNTPNVKGKSKKGDRLGTSAVVLRGFAGVGVTTLAAGMPRRAVNGKAGAGAIALLTLTPSKCKGRAPACGRVVTQATDGVPGNVTAGAAFGTSLGLIGDFNAGSESERLDSVVVGAPGAPHAGVNKAGTYSVWGPNGSATIGNPAGAAAGTGFARTAPARWTSAGLYR